MNKLSIDRLSKVHPDLRAVVERAEALLAEVEEGTRASELLTFEVTEGLRTKARQVQLVKAGASATMNSRHLTGHAVDLVARVGGMVRWDWPLYGRLAEVMKGAAVELKIDLVWGGDWVKLRDGPHFELSRGAYP